MSRRVASVAAALLLTACSLPFVDSPPLYGFITITSAGEPLVGGSTNVTPTLDLRLHAESAFGSGDVSATLDRTTLPITLQNGDATAHVAPMPLGSPHHLDVSIKGRAQAIDLNFTVIAPTQAQLAAHIDARGGTVVDVAFDDPPSRAAVDSALRGASVDWIDAVHARVTWSGSHPGSVALPAGLPTARGSHLAGALSLDLSGLQPGILRRVVVPAPPNSSTVPVLAFVVNTAVSNTSMAHHERQLHWVSPTGWQAQHDGSILGTPDQPAVLRAAAAGISIYPSLANDSNDPSATTALLTSAAAVGDLVSTVVSSVADDGYAGVNLDFEGMAPEDQASFTVFVKRLAGALHAAHAKLIVDVVPEDTGGGNRFSAAYDVPSLSHIADYIDLMAYDEHGDGGTPGPVAGLDWDRSILAATLPGLNPAHTFLGIPLYARRWVGGGGAGASYAEAVAQALAVPGARIDYDFSAETPFIESPGPSYVTYFDDADSLARKVALAREDKLAGVAAWRLGFEDPAVWSVLG